MAETTKWEPDEEGVIREHRREAVASVECERCGSELDLMAETEGWVMDDEGRWAHESFGPGQGVCCGLLYADWFDGGHVYDLTAEPEPAEEDEHGR
jgi:hypothetical protein